MVHLATRTSSHRSKSSYQAKYATVMLGRIVASFDHERSSAILRKSNCGNSMLPLDRRHRFDGQEVAWGRMGDGPALVLIHGTPFSSQTWRRIAPLLARRWTVYYFDLLGYGLSDMRDQQDVSLSVQNRLLVSLFAEWKIDRPDVLCHDFGGATALRGYFLNGLRYHSLTIFDAVAVAPWGSPFVAHVRKHETAFAGLPPIPMRRCFVRICKVPPIVL
jgi:pimeloyl-ACP methyl ester carboxylesterase